MSNIISGEPVEAFGGYVQFQFVPGTGDITIEAAHKGMPLSHVKTVTAADAAADGFEAFEDIRLGAGTFVVTLSGDAQCSSW